MNTLTLAGITALFLSIAGGMAYAQNSELSILVGVSGVTPSVGTSSQINFAWQVLGTRAGSLYVELPFVVTGHEGSDVPILNRGLIAFTPGVKFKVSLGARVTPYVVLGGGVASFGSSIGDVTNRVTRGVFDFGGGVGFRLTRLISLRAEVRDLIGRASAAAFPGLNHPIAQLGVGLHF